MRKEMVETRGCKLRLDAFQFVGISRGNRVPNNAGVFKLRCNWVKYNRYKHSRDEKEK
jgi:hypothetical protein